MGFRESLVTNVANDSVSCAGMARRMTIVASTAAARASARSPPRSARYLAVAAQVEIDS